MRNIPLWLVVFCIVTAFTADRKNTYPPVRNESFKKGEELHFKMTYGIFTIGRGITKVHSTYFNLNDRQCFKVDVSARTVGFVNWVKDVDDQFSAYIDTASLLPQLFTRTLREGDYKKDEQTRFDQENKKISVITIDKKTGKWKEPINYDAPTQMRDMIGGFLYLRTVDLSKMNVHDTITVKGFFEDEFYSLKIVYQGKETIKTRVGKIRCIVFKPMVPANKLFDGENSVTAYFSDDRNRIPVKIEAEMFIGSAGVELIHVKGLKNPLNMTKH